MSLPGGRLGGFCTGGTRDRAENRFRVGTTTDQNSVANQRNSMTSIRRIRYFHFLPNFHKRDELEFTFRARFGKKPGR